MYPTYHHLRNTQLAQMREQWHRPSKTHRIGMGFQNLRSVRGIVGARRLSAADIWLCAFLISCARRGSSAEGLGSGSVTVLLAGLCPWRWGGRGCSPVLLCTWWVQCRGTVLRQRGFWMAVDPLPPLPSSPSNVVIIGAGQNAQNTFLWRPRR